MNGITDRIQRNRLAGLAMVALMATGSALAADRSESLLLHAVEQMREAVAPGSEGALLVRRVPRERHGDERRAWASLQERQAREQAKMVLCDVRLSPRLRAPTLEEVNVAAPFWSRVSAAEPHSAP